MTLQNLSLWDVAIAALLIVVNGAVSVALKWVWSMAWGRTPKASASAGEGSLANSS